MGLLSRANEIDLRRRFEAFVGKALATTYQVADGSQFGCDFVLTSQSGSKAVVEVKLNRSKRATLSTVRNAAAALQAARSAANATHAILVLNTLPDDVIEREARICGVLVYDIEILANLSSKSFELLFDLEDIQQQAVLSQPEAWQLGKTIRSFDHENVESKVTRPKSNEGGVLCETLKGIEPGRAHSRLYEKCCEAALQYLFAEDLAAWSAQNDTDEGLHRFDLIARVSSRNDFWRCLQESFRGQYVVFEFKNHAEPITQAQIYTTEKYLYPLALRGTAIIFSRKGADDHAMMAARGALREGGKLILNCSDSDLERMLRGKDAGEEPSNLLLSILDEMLMKIER